MPTTVPPPIIDELRTLLRSQRPIDNLKAMEAASLMHGAAASLVPDLTLFLDSEAYASYTSRGYGPHGHAILAEHAMGTIEEIGVPPALEDLRRLLADRRVIIMPEASFDQGAYIGDYSSTTFSPAGLAARLVLLHAEQSFLLLPELVTAALDDAEEIGKPARRALKKLAGFAAKTTAEHRAALIAEVERIANLPEALTPTTSRGFALRDLTRHCRKVLGQAS